MRHKYSYYTMIKWILFTVFYEILIMSMSSTSADVPIFGHESDRLALLDLKSRTLKDPLKIMSSWNDSMHYCDWLGVTCNNTTGRVLVLNLEARELTGSVPPSIGNLTYLTEFRLGNNYFHGGIPQEFGRLRRLRHLNLSFNNFGGELPANISHCTDLVRLHFDINDLKGQIPDQFSMLTKLDGLGFGGNNLTGTIPSWIGNFSSLFSLSFAQNNFQGSIPSELGRLHRLQLFTVYGNNLTGTVPSSLYNITSMTYFSLTQNRLQGTLPPNIGFSLPNLQVFAGAVNNFTGHVPTSFANASRLQILDFSENGLTGMVPENLGSLVELERLNLDDNELGNGEVGDLDLISFLGNCTKLRVLGLAGNRFGGTLPPSLGNLTQLNILTLGRNMLSGSIPPSIGNLINLQVLGMEYNYVNGSLPHSIGKLQNLQNLHLHVNRLSMSIPSSIGNISSLTKLFMEYNKLEGNIPQSLGQCERLQVLGLSRNRLSGTIPREVLGLSSLSIYLALDHNSFTGPLHSEVGQLVGLTMLDVSENKLSGDIPSNLGKCTSMERLLLGGNQFEGTIPQSLEDLRGLEELNLSSNNLSGKIPQFLGKLQALKRLNLSYNHFEGEVPKQGIFSNYSMISVSGNNNLCNGMEELHLPPCPANRTHPSHKFQVHNLLIPVLGTVTFLVILLSIFSACFWMKTRRGALTPSSSKDIIPQISYLELNKSTDGFSVENLIGSGSFGSVYRGVLLDGSIVAVKVLNLQQQGASKSFIDECKALTSIRHRNLLRIITSCSSIDVQGNQFKALVFDFISNGNLDHWLHPANKAQNQRIRLSLIQRLNIAIDIANALNYLHNDCETQIVHCDLKPSNVLLDEDMVAHVADFGLARFILEGSNQPSSSQTLSLALRGSIGYVPPEYGIGGGISIQGDIYSYGILILEMITGKRPTDDTFVDGLDIYQFTAMALPHRALDIVDPSLLSEEENEQRMIEECLVSMMRIGLSCSSTAPRERMLMNVVVNKLQAIRSSYLKFKNTSL